MKIRGELMIGLVFLGGMAFTTGCSKKTANLAIMAAPQRHEHKPPHGGTPVVLGDEAYHVELVLDAANGALQAYVFDGEMENFIRVPAAFMEIDAWVDGAPQTLVLQAVANPATGETVGDTALFADQADWLKTVREFEGTLKKVTIHGTTFTGVKFNFPKGNDKD